MIGHKLLRHNPPPNKLFILLPGAAVPFSAHKKIIANLNKYADVLFIESGYYGLGTSSCQNLNDFSLSAFRKNLHQLLSQYTYSHLYFLTGSVGAIHALDYQHHYPKRIKKVFLTSPAISRQQPLFRLTSKLLLFPIIHFHSDLIFSLILKLLHTAKQKELACTLKRVVGEVGLVPFACCLNEILEFPKQNWVKERLKNIAVVILGQNDIIFNTLCDSRLCQQAPVCVTIPGGHRVISDSPDEIFSLIKKEFA